MMPRHDRTRIRSGSARRPVVGRASHRRGGQEIHAERAAGAGAHAESGTARGRRRDARHASAGAGGQAQLVPAGGPDLVRRAGAARRVRGSGPHDLPRPGSEHTRAELRHHQRQPVARGAAVPDQLRGSLHAHGFEAGSADLGLRQDFGRGQRSRGRRDGHDRARGGRARRCGAQRAQGLLGAQAGARAAIDAGGGRRIPRQRAEEGRQATGRRQRQRDGRPIACACARCGPRSRCGCSRPSGWKRSRAAGCGRW